MEKDNKSSKQESKALIRELRGCLHDNFVFRVIAELWELNDMYTNYKLQERLTAIDNDYKMMKKYWCEGVVDDKREELYDKIVADLDDLLCDMEMERMKCNLSFFMDCRRNIAMSGVDFTLTEVKSRLEAFVSDFAMTELLPEQQKSDKLIQLHANHQQYLDLMFNYILCIGNMSKIEVNGWTDILTSPTIDATDRQILLAALVINMQNVPQRSKMRCLLNIYEMAEDDYVRQPALVGWALALHFEKLAIDSDMEQEIKSIMSSPTGIKELLSLQMQILVSMNAEQDSRLMDIEISKVRMTREYRRIADELEGNDVDHSLDDVLNAGENNAQMDEWMESISKISDMRKKGADIFFGSFSQIKNSGFFTKPINWFVNFYLEHPDICSTINIHPNLKKFLTFFGSLPMLPTDKYSFVLVTAKMAKRLPPEMLKQAFDDFPSDIQMPEFQDKEAKGMEIRDSFTKLLYRFYKLFWHRECFDNPMEANKNTIEAGTYLFLTNEICKETHLLSNLVPFLKTLYKLGHKNEIRYIVKAWKESVNSPDENNDFDFVYFWGAYCNEMYHTRFSDLYNWDHNDASRAAKYLQIAHNLRPEMQSVTKRLLDSYYHDGEFKKVIALAEEIKLSESTDCSLLSKYAISLYREMQLDEAEKVFYKVIYLSPNEHEAIREMPRVLIEQKKYIQAEKLVIGWMADDTILNENRELYQLMALFCYRRGEVDATAKYLAQYIANLYGIDGGQLSSKEIKDNLTEYKANIISTVVKIIDFYCEEPLSEIDKNLLMGCTFDYLEDFLAKMKVSEERGE